MQMELFTTLFLFAVRYHRTANKNFSLSNCKWKLSNANKNYRMQMKIIPCKWKLSNANENYRMQMKIIQCKWKIIASKWKIIQCKWKIIACKWKIIQCKWKRSNSATFHMPYNISYFKDRGRKVAYLKPYINGACRVLCDAIYYCRPMVVILRRGRGPKSGLRLQI